MDRFIPLHASPSHEFEVSEPGRVHTLATTVAGGLRADNMTLTAAPSAAVSWTHGGIGTNRLHSHLLQRELLGSGHVSVAASPSSSPGHRSAATGLLLARESDASHWSVGGPLDTAQPGAAAPEGVSDQSQRPRATGVAAEARAAVLLSTPPRHRVLHFGSPGSGRRMATQSDTDSSIELDSSFESGAGGRGLTAALAAASPAPSYDADENLGRRGGGGSGLDWGAAAAAAVAGSPGAQSSRMSTMSTATGSSGGASSTMSPLAMASAAAAVIRRQGLVGLSAGSEELLRSPKRTRRKISRVPYKVLDAPALVDDFYLNLLSWSSTNVLAVALARDVYTWEGRTAKVTHLLKYPEGETCTSVGWAQAGSQIACGSSSGVVTLFDSTTNQRLRELRGHTQRATCMSWAAHTLATGSKDRSILIRDVRSPAEYEICITAHRQEVCGLQWSPDWTMLASGGNDNQTMVWSAARIKSGGTPGSAVTSPLWNFSGYKAACKAIAWSPHQPGLLANGAGTADRRIRFFTTTTGQELSSVDTGSQVCTLIWSLTSNEIVSTQGYSTNTVVVWRFPAMSPLATLTGHNTRVLYSALSPDGQTVVTGAGDETLRFWHLFPSSTGAAAPSDGPAAAGLGDGTPLLLPGFSSSTKAIAGIR